MNRMSNRSSHLFSRREAIAGFAAAVACGAIRGNAAGAEAAPNGMPGENCGGPIFSATGPDAELYGAAEGYPVPEAALARRRGNPWDPKYRVGAFSHVDEIYQTRLIERAASPWMFKCATADVRYGFRGNQFSLPDYLSRHPVTGLLIAKDDRILFEHYQYGRTDRDRLSHSRWSSRLPGC